VALGYGLRSGGGVGDIFKVTVGKRWLLDFSFFFVINIGMLNLIGGAIITTFGQLRENKARRLEDTVGVCFICGIDKQIFDRASAEPEGFKTHVKVDHNMWNYLYFIFMLWEQDRDDDDGLEQYVRRAIDANEITWFPMNKAIRLNQAASKEESMLNDLKKKIGDTENSISNKLDRFQMDINIALEQLNLTLKQDHATERKDMTVSKSARASRPAMTMVAGAVPVNAIPLPAVTEQLVNRVYASMNMKILMIELLEISNVYLPTSDVNKVLCSIYLDDEVHTSHPMEIVCQEAVDAELQPLTLLFPPGNKCKLVENVVFEDNRFFQLQLSVIESSESNDESKEVISVNVKIEDLLLAEGSKFEIIFTVPNGVITKDGEKEEVAAKMVLIPWVFKKSY
jgi:hypothetical protein